MQRIFVFLVLCALALPLAGAVVAQDVDKLQFPPLNEVKIPDVKLVTLDNGMRLYVLRDATFPIFRASVRVNVGSYLEPADKIGLADICGEVLRTGGTKKWTGDEIDEMLEGVGGSVETSIGLLSGSASVNVLSDYKEMGLEVLSQVLREPTFDEDKIELAKVGQRSAISRRNDDPMQISLREFRKAIYGADSPYARHTEYATVNAISRDDLIAFHDTYFHPENVQIAIWGDLDEDAIVETVKKYFADWEAGGAEVPPPPAVNYDFNRQVYYAEKTDVNQSNIIMGHVGGKVEDPDYTDRIVMNSILGGGFGSRMFNNVRSKEGLAYTAFATYSSNIPYKGVFFAFSSTKSETTGKAIKEMVSTIKSMQTEKPTADEMRMGKDGYLNSFVFNFDSRGEIVNRLMNYDFYGLPRDFLQTEKQGVEKVTPEAVLAAARDNLKPDSLRVVVVGKGEDFDVSLADLGMGPVDTLDISIPSGEEQKELAMTPENLEKGMAMLVQAAEAHGGVSAFANVKTLSARGTITVSTPQGEFPIPFETVEVLPDKSYNKMTMMGQAMYDVRNGNTGWQTVQPGTIGEKTEEDLIKETEAQERNTILIFGSLDDPDFSAVYDGAGSVEGQSVEFVTLVDPEGKTICRLGINPQSHQLISKGYWGTGMMGNEGNIQEVYQDISQVGEVKLPMKTVRKIDGQKMAVIEFSDFQVNVEAPESLFTRPE